jgi:tRNA-2-methylthio-N6-dimethylallyladenosine synthase
MPTKSKNFKDSRPRIYIKTFGCQMNVRDSEALAGLFTDKGYQVTDNAGAADIILVNTCSVRAHAEDRAVSFLGTFNKKKKRGQLKGSASIIGLIGCMARNKGERVFEKMPHINLIVAPSNLAKIPQYCERILNDKTDSRGKKIRILDLEYEPREEYFYSSDWSCEQEQAQVVISTGCSNFCSYCIVPFTRGELNFRAPDSIIAEVKRNIKQGRRRITLLGQNVNDYRIKINAKLVGFLDLLKRIESLPGLEELYFISANPKNTSKELIDFLGESRKIKKQLHLPLQSGSNRILKLMQRGYTREHYLDLINYYREKVGGAIGTDIIVGFPRESDKDFADTEAVLEQVRFDYAYIFKYSPRPHTRAAELEDDVAPQVKAKRHQRLLDLQKKISNEKKS